MAAFFQKSLDARNASIASFKLKSASAVAAFHCPFHFALAFAVFDGVALIVFGLALGKCNLAFDEACLPMEIDGHKCETLLFDFAGQAVNFFALQKQLPGASGFGVDMG